MVMGESSHRGGRGRLSPPEAAVKQTRSVRSSSASESNNALQRVRRAFAGVLHSPARTVIPVLELLLLQPEILCDKRGNLSS